jgi:hypothetical protein
MNVTMTSPKRKNWALETSTAELPGRTSWNAVTGAQDDRQQGDEDRAEQ